MFFVAQKWLYRRFLEIFIYPSIWVAASIASLSIYFQKALNLPLDWRSPALILFTAIIFYNLDRIFDARVQEIPDNKLQDFFEKKFSLFIVLIATLASAIILILAPREVQIVSLGALVPLLYGMPLLKVKEKWYRLKDIPGIKAVLVAGTLTYAVVALPLAYTNAELESDRAILLTIFLSIFIGTNSHLFDFRDIKYDRDAKVLTLPLVIGIRSTRILFTLLNLLVLVILSWYYWSSAGTVPTPITIGITVILDLMIIWWVQPTTPRNIYNIWIDGSLFLPSLLIAFER